MKGFAMQHIDSFNEFIKERLKKIITAKLNKRVTSEADPDFYLLYEDITVAKPAYERVSKDSFNKVAELYPN